MNMWKAAALFLWMLGSGAWLCICYIRLQKHRRRHQKQSVQPINNQQMKHEKTQLLDEWEDQLWISTEINDL